MTDKAKILAEIERRKKFYYDRYIKKGVGCIEESRYDECVDLLDFINSLPAERPYKTGDKVWYLNELYTLEDDGKHYILTSARDNVTASVVHLDYGCEDFKLLPYEEPVSKELKEAAIEICSKILKGETVVIDGYEYVVLSDAEECFKVGAKWQKENLWKPADGDDLPEYDREVVVFTQNFPNDAGIMSVAIGYRPNPDGWDGKSLSTGKVEHYTSKTYGKGGWNIPNIVLWLDVELPKETE